MAEEKKKDDDKLKVKVAEAKKKAAVATKDTKKFAKEDSPDKFEHSRAHLCGEGEPGDEFLHDHDHK